MSWCRLRSCLVTCLIRLRPRQARRWRKKLLPSLRLATATEMTLVLVTAPTVPVVSTDALCAQLKVTEEDDLALIDDYERSVVAYLDGWGGVLGRAIREQVWRQEFPGWGTLHLAMPDVSAVTVTAEDAEGNAVAPTRADLRASSGGPYVIAEGPEAARVFVQFTCALPASKIPAAQQIVRMMVAHWYANREAVSEATTVVVPLGASALIAALRWRTI